MSGSNGNESTRPNVLATEHHQLSQTLIGVTPGTMNNYSYHGLHPYKNSTDAADYTGLHRYENVKENSVALPDEYYVKVTK